MIDTRKQPAAVVPETFTIAGKAYTFTHNTTISAARTVAAILAKPQEKRTRADETALVKCLWIVHHQNTAKSKSKLAGIDSISSSALDNPLCARLHLLPDCICRHCYAITQQEAYSGLAEHNIINGLILRNHLFSVSSLRFLPICSLFARIESFGDVSSILQARNYIRIIRAFKSVHFGIWTKHPGIWSKAIQAEGKRPCNLTFVVSSPLVNVTLNLDLLRRLFPALQIDHVFTVYDKTAIADGQKITCGGLSCMDCIRARKGCYFKASKRNPVFVSEELK